MAWSTAFDDPPPGRWTLTFTEPDGRNAFCGQTDPANAKSRIRYDATLHLAVTPETSLLDIEPALRAAASQTYLVANSTTAGFQIVFGTPGWHAALADAGLTVEQNWAALARRK